MPYSVMKLNYSLRLLPLRLLAVFCLFFGMLTRESVAANEQSTTVLQHLIEQAKQTGQQMRREDEQRLAEFKQNYQTQLNQLRQTEQYLAGLNQQLADADKQYDANVQLLRQKRSELQQQREKYQSLFNEIRHAARELVLQIRQGSFYPLAQSWLMPIIQFAEQDSVVTAQQVRNLWIAYLEWIQLSGAIQHRAMPVIYPSGEEEVSEITYIGPFSLYTKGNWLTYLPDSQQLMLMIPQPDTTQFKIPLLKPNSKNEINVLIDPKHGKLIKQLTELPTIWDELQAGGIVGGIIILLGLFAIGVVVIRVINLKRIKKSCGTTNAKEQAELLSELKSLNNELIEGRLSENLQARCYNLNKGASFITTVATVAPLLGLLGTVIGMIDTFQALMLYGNEDPSALSGGISKALVTTELGLVVAIPLVLVHSQLQSIVQTIKSGYEQFYTKLYVELLQSSEE